MNPLSSLSFEIHDDMEVLKRMGLSLGLERGQVSAENLARAQSMVPKALEQYVTQLAENGPGERVVSCLPKILIHHNIVLST